MNLLIDSIGVIGLVILLIALIINVRRRTRSRTVHYYILQFFGAMLLCIYAALNSIQIFVILEGLWALVALYFLYENIIILRIEKKLKKKK